MNHPIELHVIRLASMAALPQMLRDLMGEPQASVNPVNQCPASGHAEPTKAETREQELLAQIAHLQKENEVLRKNLESAAEARKLIQAERNKLATHLVNIAAVMRGAQPLDLQG